jgi:hypothetical protein
MISAGKGYGRERGNISAGIVKSALQPDLVTVDWAIVAQISSQ